MGQLDAATRGLAFRRPPSPLAQLIDQSQVAALYSSIGSEAPTARLTEYLTEIGKKLVFPLVDGDKPLIFKAVSNIDMLESGYNKIPEPKNTSETVDPDLIITPLIAFDRSMRRLGQGRGHYDRTFAKYPQAIRVGLAWSVQEADAIPVGPYDINLHMIITECEIIQKVSMAS